MNNKKIVDYVMQSPNNTNPAVLESMLEAINGGGGDAVTPMGEMLHRVVGRADKDATIFGTVIFPNQASDDALTFDIEGMQLIRVSSVEDAKIGMQGICLVNFGATSDTTSVRKYSLYKNIDGDPEGGLVTGFNENDEVEFLYISKAMFDQFTEEGDNPLPTYGLFVNKNIVEDGVGVIALVSFGVT